MVRAQQLFLFFLFFGTQSFPQDSVLVRDFETWTGVNLEASFFKKKLEVNLHNELRFNNNSTARDIFYAELGVSYEIYKNLKLGAAFRYINETEKTGANQYRYQFDISYAHKIKRFKLSYRTRFQRRDYFDPGDGDYAMNKFRLRVKAVYDIKKFKLSPYCSVEGFYGMTKADGLQYIDEVPVDIVSLRGFQKMRYTLGATYKVFKGGSINLFYRIEQGLRAFPTYYASFTPAPLTSHIVGLRFSYKIPIKKKKKTEDSTNQQSEEK